jgi:two-component system sensor kinase FixL
VRAFSELASEPPVRQARVDVNALAEERMAFLRHGNPDVIYQKRLDPARPVAWVDEDLTRGILTNLLENAAQAAGAGGVVLVLTRTMASRVAVEIHDSGPGMSTHARRTVFEPTISFKKTGMGLGLSIARKSALLNAGDIELIEGELGGAAFRVTLPAAGVTEESACEPASPLSTTKKISAVRSA